MSVSLGVTYQKIWVTTLIHATFTYDSCSSVLNCVHKELSTFLFLNIFIYTTTLFNIHLTLLLV